VKILVIQSKTKALIVLALLSLWLLNGCANGKQSVKGRTFEFSSVIKSDVDLVTETHQKMVFSALKELAVKLYKRNPKEWKKAGYASIKESVTPITTNPFPKVNNKTSIDAIRLAFDQQYEGDRVKALIVGLETMVLDSYDGHRSVYFYNMLEAQKLYDSARNIELASWLLRTKHDSNNQLFLLSTGEGGEGDELNLSFERLFGKIINAQDMMAQIMADRSHRQIKNAIQSVARVFIPI
jgi:hypothetical protein